MSHLHPLHSASLPVTGQTAVYSAGDDGDVRAGVASTARFLDHGDGTLTDLATGLRWVIDPTRIIPGSSGQVQAAKGDWLDATAYVVGDLVADAGGFFVCIEGHTGPGDASTQPSVDVVHWVQTPWTASAADLTTPAAVTWSQALALCSNGTTGLTYCGIGPWSPSNPGGWRLPNLLELCSLADHGISVGYLLDDTFVAPDPPTYWSSTTMGSSTSNAKAAIYSQNNMTYRYAKTDLKLVRPVCGGLING